MHADTVFLPCARMRSRIMHLYMCICVHVYVAKKLAV